MPSGKTIHLADMELGEVLAAAIGAAIDGVFDNFIEEHKRYEHTFDETRKGLIFDEMMQELSLTDTNDDFYRIYRAVRSAVNLAVGYVHEWHENGCEDCNSQNEITP